VAPDPEAPEADVLEQGTESVDEVLSPDNIDFVPEADALEQAAPVKDEPPIRFPSNLDFVPEADALEQSMPVDADDDYTG
jgi:hypothetical protein